MDSLILFGTGALLLRVGLALYSTGLSRSKNSAGAVMRSACDLCAAVLAFWAIGAAILLQTRNGVLGVRAALLFAGGHDSARLLFLAAVVAVASGAVTGAIGERSRFAPVLAASVLLAAFVVPVAGKWAWTGWLHRLGFADAAGASFLHVVGGVTALVAARVIGPRNGKYHRDGSASVIPGHSIPLAGAGVMVLTVAWIPYVAGCAAAFPGAGGDAGAAALNVLLAAAAGGMAAMGYGRLRYGKPDVLLTLTGVLGALAAVSAAGGLVAAPWAAGIGAVAGVLVPYVAAWIDLVGRVDDPAGSVAVHAVGGAWGTLAVGLFAPGSIGHRLQHLGVQALGLLVIAAFAGACAVGLFATLKATIGVRATEADEFDGLDLADHDIGAYPDFQQNTIRSYHLREA